MAMALSPRTLILVVLFCLALYTLLLPDPQRPHLQPQQPRSKEWTASSSSEAERTTFEELRRADAKSRVRQALAVLGDSAWGDFAPSEGRWANVTGLREEHGFAWERLGAVKDRVRQMAQRAVGEDGRRTFLDEDADGHFDGKKKHKKLDNEPERAFGSMYKNMSGYVMGNWIRSPLDLTNPETRTDSEGDAELAQPPKANLSAIYPEGAYAADQFERNITGDTGFMRIRFLPKVLRDPSSADGSIQEVAAHLMIRHHLPRGDELDLSLQGVHFLDFGGIILTTSSEKFAGLFSLPLFAPSPYTFAISQSLLNNTLREAVDGQRRDNSFMNNGWTDPIDGPVEPVFSAPQCEYIVYLQQYPVAITPQAKTSGTNNIPVEAVENEIRYPSGLGLPRIPALEISALAFSPDCGAVIESKGPPDHTPQDAVHLRGPKLETFIADSRHVILLGALVIVAEINLLIRQMKESNTPSTRSRVSFYAIALLALGDGFACMILLPLGVLASENLQPLQAMAFLSFVLVVVFGMKFITDIWAVQVLEERTRSRQQHQPPTTLPAASGTVSHAMFTGDTLPLPVTAPRRPAASTSAVIVRSDGELDSDAEDSAGTTGITAADTPAGPPTQREITAVHVRFYLAFLFLVFTSLNATSWALSHRSMYTHILSFLYLSFWLPQIHRNVMRNCRKALRWDFVIGQSILRLLLLAYFYGVLPIPSSSYDSDGSRRYDNVFLIDTANPVAFTVLAAWLWVQIWLLLSQQLLGPRFFVRASWVPPAYDYHPVLREDEEGSLPIGFTINSVGGNDNAASGLTSPTHMRRSAELKRDKGKRVFDCAICMQDVEVPILPSVSFADGGGASSTVNATASGAGSGASTGHTLAASFLARTAYMVTPCRHIFHSNCLEGWMRYRLQCPICREVLPPL